MDTLFKLVAVRPCIALNRAGEEVNSQQEVPIELAMPINNPGTAEYVANAASMGPMTLYNALEGVYDAVGDYIYKNTLHRTTLLNNLMETLDCLWKQGYHFDAFLLSD